eukprot:5787316-Pyramimonas_sp.AAC.1
MGRLSRAPAPPPGFGRRSPSGSTNSFGHSPTNSTASKKSATQPSSSWGKRRNSATVQPSRPGFFRLGMWRSSQLMSSAVQGCLGGNGGRPSSSCSQSSPKGGTSCRCQSCRQGPS